MHVILRQAASSGRHLGQLDDMALLSSKVNSISIVLHTAVVGPMSYESALDLNLFIAHITGPVPWW
jgi:hypothetical protein